MDDKRKHTALKKDIIETKTVHFLPTKIIKTKNRKQRVKGRAWKFKKDLIKAPPRMTDHWSVSMDDYRYKPTPEEIRVMREMGDPSPRKRGRKRK